MGNLFNALNGLKTNIFGGGNTGQTTPILRKTATGMLDESPLSVLDHDPFAYSSIQYPRNLTSNGGIGHYMLFYVNVQEKTKYTYNNDDGVKIGGFNEVPIYETRTRAVGPAGSQTEEYRVQVGSEYVQNDGKFRAKYQEGLNNRKGRTGIAGDDGIILNKQQRTRHTGMASYHNTTKRISDSVAIYLPPNVTDSTVASYNGAATGILGFAAAGGAGLIEAMNNKDFEAAAKSLVGSAKGFLSEAAKNAAAELAEGLTNAEGGLGLINKAFGQADNPYMEVLFDKMELRTFTYQFTFSPKNTQETEDVQKIIALFRFHMAPELKGQNNRFLTLPSEFDIHYMYQDQAGQASENDFYNKIATCVLTNCEVNYTPDGVKSFEGGAPTKITMALTFQETELLTKQRINEGY